MDVELREVTKGKGIALPATSARFSSGAVTRIVMETEQRPTVLGLIASGRMRPETGTVLIDGRDSRSELKRRIALVDAPGVSEPEPDVTLAGTIAEELMYAGRPNSPVAARLWARSLELLDAVDLPMADVPPAQRIRALTELAALRTQRRGTNVEGLVLVSPDRHGGDPHQWIRVCERMAARGLAVLVITGSAADQLLAADSTAEESV